MSGLSLRTKLYALSGFLLFVAFTLGGIGLWSGARIASTYDVIAEINTPKLEHLNQMILLARQLRVEMTQLSLDGITEADTTASLKEIDTLHKRISGSEEKYKALPMGENEAPLFQAFVESMTVYNKLIDQGLRLHQASTDPASAARKQLTHLILNDMRESADTLRINGVKIRDYHSDWSKRNIAEAKLIGQISRWLSMGTLAMGLLLGLGFSLVFTRNLSGTLQRIAESIKGSTTQVSSASSLIASSSEELSQAATEQAASLEETAASIEEMNSMVTKNMDNAKQTALLSSESEKTATRGKQTVEEMIQSMAELNKSNEQIGEIVRIISEIGNKTKVINDIVFQTKLLSFNASVEAARAGEHGKGFSVVAEEVGNLAQMSGNAAKEISILLSESVSKVESIVEETKKRVESGTHIAHQCGEILEEIVAKASSVSTMADQISTASEEQARGVQEITKAMHQLDQVTQTNAATSEESASAAEELSAQAQSLLGLVEELNRSLRGSAKEDPVLPLTGFSRQESQTHEFQRQAS